jgi:glycine cleavage system H lipoate-binding protein
MGQNLKVTLPMSVFQIMHKKALGAVVFIELPKVGATIAKGETFGAVESP